MASGQAVALTDGTTRLQFRANARHRFQLLGLSVLISDVSLCGKSFRAGTAALRWREGCSALRHSWARTHSVPGRKATDAAGARCSDGRRCSGAGTTRTTRR